jgi:hypothetical protein
MDNKNNDLQNETGNDPRPSKSGVACSNHAESARIKGVNADAVTPPPPETQGRETLNAGKLLADTAAQVQRLREMAEPLKRRAQEYARQAAASDNAGMTGIARLEAQVGAVSAMDAAAMLAAADALEREAGLVADAERYRWLRAESLIHWEDGKRRNRLSFPTIYAADRVDGGSYRDRFNAAIDAARGAK